VSNQSIRHKRLEAKRARRRTRLDNGKRKGVRQADLVVAGAEKGEAFYAEFKRHNRLLAVAQREAVLERRERRQHYTPEPESVIATVPAEPPAEPPVEHTLTDTNVEHAVAEAKKGRLWVPKRLRRAERRGRASRA
jgi:hypothetical protein